MELDNESGRVPLELEAVKIQDGDLIVSFYYPSNLNDHLMEDIRPYKDKLYKTFKAYELCYNESVLIMKFIGDFYDQSIIKIVTDIIDSDNEALLNTRHDDDMIRELASFKIRVCKEKTFSFDDIFGTNDEY